ncbi:MAG: hypothetical protein WCF67_13925 [Chitinophagaceae bacterium]
MKKIAEFYLRTLVPGAKFNSKKPVDDQALLFPDFLSKVKACIQQYKLKHPAHDITFTETYRSNALQEIHFNNGASKIKKNGMHHYGISVDCIFIIGGKRTYKGDVTLIRKIYKDNGLTILGAWDPLHVQFIPVADQPELRKAVSARITQFQKENGLAQTGEENAATIAKAKTVFA